MALILNIETSSAVCSVCIAGNGLVLDYREDRTKNSHARVLTLLVEDLLKSNNIGFDHLDAIAVSAGPGSYTGLRIGVSAAKGFCYALNKPLIAVPTLLALGMAIQQNTAGTAQFYMPVIDARRMDAYTVVYDRHFNEVVSPGAYTLNGELEEKLIALGPVAIGGDAIEKCKTVFETAPVSYTEGIECHAALLAPVAVHKFERGEFADVAYFEPMYLKEFYGKQPGS